jgi:hypothetical protein
MYSFVCDIYRGDGVTAAAIGRQFVDAGATVYCVMAKNNSSDKSNHQHRLSPDQLKLDEQYNYNKLKVEVDLNTTTDASTSSNSSSALYELIVSKKAACFITDAPVSQLKKHGLDFSNHQKPSSTSSSISSSTSSPLPGGVVFGLCTPWGLEGKELPRGELGAFWSNSGMGATVTGSVNAQRGILFKLAFFLFRR